MPRQPKLKENEVLLKNGQIWKCHPKSVCADDVTPCVFHSPTNHVMSMLPLSTRYDRSFFFNKKTNRPSYSGFRPGPYGETKEDYVLLLLLERICEHGVGHPDLDCVRWLESVYPNAWGVHGCCAHRCCFDPNSGPARRASEA